MIIFIKRFFVWFRKRLSRHSRSPFVEEFTTLFTGMRHSYKGVFAKYLLTGGINLCAFSIWWLDFYEKVSLFSRKCVIFRSIITKRYFPFCYFLMLRCISNFSRGGIANLRKLNAPSIIILKEQLTPAAFFLFCNM